MDDANQDVLEKIDSIKSVLPNEAKTPLILRYDPTLDPVLVLGIWDTDQSANAPGSIETLKRLRRVADREIRRVLEPVPGVAALKVKGGLEEEIRVDLDEGQLRRMGIPISKVVDRLRSENINLAGGLMRDGRTRYLVRTVNEFRSLKDLGALVIERREDREVYLRDIAAITSDYKERDVITRIDGREAVEVAIFKESDANIVEMANRVRERIDSKLAQPFESEGMALRVVSDRSTFVEASVSEVRNTAVVGGILAVAALFLFLGELRSTVIVAVAIPISIVITFAPLKVGSVSLNIMSLGGLAMGVGMLVDNAIVVLESIYRCTEEGDDLIDATLRGTAEVGSAVTASTLTSIAVFLPMIFVEGIAGQLFGDLALAVVSSLLASLAVALFLIPMLASRRVRTDADSDPVSLLRMWASWPSTPRLPSLTHVTGNGVARAVYLLTRALAQLSYEVIRWVIAVGFSVIGRAVVTLVVAAFLMFRALLWPRRQQSCV